MERHSACGRCPPSPSPAQHGQSGTRNLGQPQWTPPEHQSRGFLASVLAPNASHAENLPLRHEGRRGTTGCTRHRQPAGPRHHVAEPRPAGVLRPRKHPEPPSEASDRLRHARVATNSEPPGQRSHQHARPVPQPNQSNRGPSACCKTARHTLGSSPTASGFGNRKPRTSGGRSRKRPRAPPRKLLGSMGMHIDRNDCSSVDCN